MNICICLCLCVLVYVCVLPHKVGDKSEKFYQPEEKVTDFYFGRIDKFITDV